jgi:predicted membrane protein
MAIAGKVVGAAIALLVIIILLIVGAFFIGQTLLDIFVILAALFSLIAFALLGYAALQVVGLVQEVRGEVKALVGTAQETMTEVRGTAQFISDTVVHPVSQAASFVTATRATVRSFTEPLYKRRS